MIWDSVRAKDWSAGVLQTAGQISPEWLGVLSFAGDLNSASFSFFYYQEMVNELKSYIAGREANPFALRNKMRVFLEDNEESSV